MKKWLFLAGCTLSMGVCAQNSPYINKVYEYAPAPGQFVNVMPEVTPKDTETTVLQKVQTAIAGKANGSLVSLGAWGGYIVVGFDHPVNNLPEEVDLKIYGNAMLNASEPGVVMVAQDANANGLPDDAWYELKGSEHDNELTLTDYQVVYHRPASDHLPTPHPTQNQVSDLCYIQWEAVNGEKGYLEKNTFHTQDYFPLWIKEDTIVRRGTRLPNNTIDKNGDGTYYATGTYEWGYADNQPNGKDASCVDIDWAVDENGDKAHLSAIDFVKVYTGVLQSNGWTGECSTEIAGIVDLHALKSDHNHTIYNMYIKQMNDNIYIYAEAPATFVLYDMLGNKVCEEDLQAGENTLKIPAHRKGIFIACIYANHQIHCTQKIYLF